MYVDVPLRPLSPLQWGDILPLVAWRMAVLSGLLRGPVWLQQDCYEGMQRGVDNVLVNTDPLISSELWKCDALSASWQSWSINLLV
jgi:hypothetical protein